MRRFDKNKNMLRANILNEQRRLRDIGYLSEIEDMDIAYKFLTEEEVEIDNAETDVDESEMGKEVEEPSSEFPDTNAGSYEIRFNLSRSGVDKITGKKIFFTWKIGPDGRTEYLGDNLLNFNPDELLDKVSTGGVRNNFNTDEFNLQLENCVLKNTSPSSAYGIKCHTNKTVIANLTCRNVVVNYGSGSPGSPESQVIYNPRVVPHWLEIASTDLFETATNEPIHLGDTKLEIKKYEDGVVYESCVSIQKGVDDKLPKTKYYYIQNGGERYVKVVEPDVTSYKGVGKIYRIIDGLQFDKAYTAGNKIYRG